jgi:flagellar motor component MotA
MAFAKDFPPQIAVEAGRRAIFSDSRPTFKELEAALRKSK